MKKILTIPLFLLATVTALAQDKPMTDHQIKAVESYTTERTFEILIPVLFMATLVFMLTALIKHFLEYRFKNKLIDRGMSEQLSAYLLDKNREEKQHEAIKLALLFCGIGAGLMLTYFTAPIDIHSLAIMAFSLGVSYLAYFCYLRKNKNS